MNDNTERFSVERCIWFNERELTVDERDGSKEKWRILPRGIAARGMQLDPSITFEELESEAQYHPFVLHTKIGPGQDLGTAVWDLAHGPGYYNDMKEWLIRKYEEVCYTHNQERDKIRTISGDFPDEDIPPQVQGYLDRSAARGHSAWENYPKALPTERLVDKTIGG